MVQVGDHVRILPPFDFTFGGVYLVDAIKANGDGSSAVVIMGSRDFDPAYCEVTADPLTAYEYVAHEGESVPQAISNSQARAVLLQSGLLEQAQALVDNPATPEIIRIFWNYEPNFNRSSPALNQMAEALGLSSHQVDALFVAAAQVVV